MTTRTILNRQESRRQHTREGITQAALALLLEVGYAGVSVRAITERADIGYGTFYVHYTDKDDAIWDVIHNLAETERRQTEADLATVPYPLKEYLSWVRMFTYAYENRVGFMQFFGPQGSAVLTARYLDYLTHIHEENLQAGRYSAGIDVPPDFLANFMAGALMRLFQWWLSDPDHTTPETMARLLFRVAYRTEPPEIRQG
jgi:AcrR family transcriptional regulator